MKIKISNGRVIDPANRIDCIQDLYLAEQKILAPRQQDFTADLTIDATDQIVCPGLIDLSAYPGQLSNLRQELTTAASSGITTLVCPPDLEPVTDTTSAVHQLTSMALQINSTRLLPLAALTQSLAGQQLSDLDSLQAAGCIAAGEGKSRMVDHLLRQRCFEYAASLNIKVFLNAQDYWLSQHGLMHEGTVSVQLGLPGIHPNAELIALARDLLLIEQTGVSAHFIQLSTAGAIKLIQQAKSQGLPITADVAIAHLHLTEESLVGFNSLCYVQPPLRTEHDRISLLQGLMDGDINALSSNHRSLPDDAKSAPFAQTLPGMAGLATLLPLTLAAAREANTSLSQALSWLTSQPGQILGNGFGTLAAGSVADVCVFALDIKWSLAEQSRSAINLNTPFSTTLLRGQVTHTLVAGKRVYSSPMLTGE